MGAAEAGFEPARVRYTHKFLSLAQNQVMRLRHKNEKLKFSPKLIILRYAHRVLSPVIFFFYTIGQIEINKPN